jgi:hypothetical protein
VEVAVGFHIICRRVKSLAGSSDTTRKRCACRMKYVKRGFLRFWHGGFIGAKLCRQRAGCWLPLYSVEYTDNGQKDEE